VKAIVSLQRRGFDLGEVLFDEASDQPSNWANGKPTLIKGLCSEALNDYSKDIEQSCLLYQSLLNDEECEDLLDQAPYRERLSANFECLGSSVNEGDDQEIETVAFDAVDTDNILAEDLWIKVSWLSFYEEDASLRFRFSFGVDREEDVAADVLRQQYAAQLTDAVFPESQLVTQNTVLETTLKGILNCESVRFVERIVYFNAPQGGAYLHHDRERGHAGVVYTQLSGSTFWLALSKQNLIDEILIFVANQQANEWPDSIDSRSKKLLISMASEPAYLSDELETFANNALINLINQTPEFAQQLCQHGHARILNPGDGLLLPQEDEMNCCWHSVFCIGKDAGQALSFAIRGD
jgi:hypothetical protein